MSDPEAETPIENPISTCSHPLSRVIPIAVEANVWCHWCADCGGLSSESGDVEQPKEPWILPGELNDEYVARIQRAAAEG